MTRQIIDAMQVGETEFFPCVRHVTANPHSFWSARVVERGVTGVRVWRFA